MINFKTLIRHCLLAVALAGTALGAIAGPINFHVTLDTTTLNGPGLVSFGFSKLGTVGPVTATVTNFMGAAGAVAPTGDVIIGADGFTIGTAALDNFADVDASFGGVFGFDIAFSGDFMNDAGSGVSTLFVALLDSGYGVLAGDEFGVARFNVVPGAGVSANAAFPAFATIQAVPEPSDLLLTLTGLGLVGFTVRRKKAAVQR